jgi:hypothetical protein
MAVEEYIGKNTTGGLSVGQSTTSLISFYGVTPIVQPAPAVAVGTDIATVILEIADLRAKLVALGLIAS